MDIFWETTTLKHSIPVSGIVGTFKNIQTHLNRQPDPYKYLFRAEIEPVTHSAAITQPLR